MATKITDQAIRAAAKQAAETRRRGEIPDPECQGLRLRVGPKATGWTLVVRDRAGGKRRFPLGDWPAVGLAAARDKARSLRVAVRQDGADPTADRRAARAKRAAEKDGSAPTLASLLDLYERQKGGKLRSWPEYRASIRRVFGPLLPRPLADLTAGDLQLAADGYGAQAQASLAVRCVRPILKWAAAPGRAYVGQGVTAISPPATVQRRDRTLARDELARLLPALRASASPYAAALRLMLLTLLRRSEADGARWADVEWQAGALTIGAERSKNKLAHVVPLSRQAIELLRARLPAGADPASLIFGTSTGRALGGWDKATKALQAASGTAGWHRHDLRRTGATLLGDMGETPDIIEAALNHAAIRSPLAATYNRSRYRPQVAAALQRLADALDGIETGGADIVPLRTGAVA